MIGIADALRRQGQSVTVEGVVTTKPGLLDSSNERVTIQDSTAAILLRLPANTAASLGQRIRVYGAVGTYYGAPQLSAATLSVLGQGTSTATAVRSAPIAPGLEWRLVSVSGMVDAVHRDGDAWRAELIVSGGSIPIVGLERSGIPSTALVAGRTATVTGVVKRAYPTATDQRLSVVPRSNADISLGGPTTGGSPSPSIDPRPTGGTPIGTTRPTFGAGGGSTSVDPTASGGPQASPGSSTGSADPGGPPVVAISELAAHVGESVRIGGTVTSLNAALVTVDDDTGTATVRLTGDATALIGELRADDLVNVTGLVERTAADGIEVVVGDPALLSRLPQVSLGGSASAGVDASPSHPGVVSAGVDGRPTSDGRAPVMAIAAVLGLAALALLGVAAAGQKRRERFKLALRAAVAALRSRLTRGRIAPDRG